jgi:hypothetical protein
MALEHFTAIIAHELLANPRHLAGAEKETADLRRWHAVEEIERQGRRVRHLASRNPQLAGCQALEGQGEGDALRHSQFSCRPNGRFS